MDGLRSFKRNYNYDQNQYADFDSENYSRTKPRYSAPIQHHNYPNNSRQHLPLSNSNGGGGGGKPEGKVFDPSMAVKTSYKILCHDSKVGGVIGKSGSIIKAIRQHTGAWIYIRDIAPGDEERVIEISDTGRLVPDGRMPAFSPAQEALVLIHERILQNEVIGIPGNSIRNGGDGNRVVARLVVAKMHVGSLMGKRGSIIAQMRIDTNTQIRILPRDQSPKCVSPGEEIVQVVGDQIGVKKAITIISSRLKESQQRAHGQSQGPFHSGGLELKDEIISHKISAQRSSPDGDEFNSQLLSGSPRNRNNYDSRSSIQAYESDVPCGFDRSKPFKGLVFRILCPNDRVDRVVGKPNGIIDLLQDEVGVDVKVSDPIPGSEERIIIISSDERASDDLETCSRAAQGPDHELFPAQEALLHIQTCIEDLGPDKENIVTTRLLIPASDIGFLNEGNASLFEMKKVTGADIENLPREKIPPFVSMDYELIQIVGEISAARQAVLEVTERLRSYIYKDFFHTDTPSSPDVAPSPAGNMSVAVALNTPKVAGDGYRKASSASVSERVDTRTMEHSPKEVAVSNSKRPRSNKVGQQGTTQPASNRIQIPLVTRSTLEVVLPEYAVSRILAEKKKKLGQFSRLSGAIVTLVEDPKATEKVIRMSGTRDQAEKARRILQGFLLRVQKECT